MKVYCKKSYHFFNKGEYYNIDGIHSIFEKDDFITIENRRFRLNKSTEYIENYIGENESYFYDYFCKLAEERKMKLDKINLL